MVTVSDIDTLLSQKSVDNSTCGLMTEEDAIYVEGIGHIGQYHSYLTCLWEKGTPYFVRDYMYNELQLQMDAGTSAAKLKPLIKRLNKLNSDIVAYEKSIGLDEWHRRHQPKS